jgi:signal transduction histidine kinase
MTTRSMQGVPVEQEQIWREVVDGLREPVLVLDAEGRVRAASAAARRALGSALPAGERLASLLGGEADEALPAGWRVEPLAAGKVAYGPLEAGDALRQAERELHAAVGQLAGGIAQELGPPLTAIGVAAEFLLRGMEAESAERGDLEMVLGQVERIGKLSRALVELARPSDPALAAVRLDAVVADGYALVERQLRRNRLEGALELEAGGARVRGDANQLQQVVINLVLHAQRVALAPGAVSRRVAVQTRVAGGRVELRVADGGPGLSAEEQARVLFPLFSRDGGLDLSVYETSGIIHRHGGALRVTSEPGHGATFIASFPLFRDGEPS